MLSAVVGEWVWGKKAAPTASGVQAPFFKTIASSRGTSPEMMPSPYTRHPTPDTLLLTDSENF
ncbi:hypothetical protein [Gloeothece verrucosa]|uniref:hypothetical protein n=1 Tax=Gloeothece verrucosa TaxID=2546359 RepID=UPI00017E1AED|nr:hypothetical protein [Gloeothece verrucosa]